MAQFKSLDVGYGFGMAQQQNSKFEIDGYPIEIELEGFVEQHGYVRMTQTIKNYDILHTVSISEIRFVNSVSPDSLSGAYSDRNIYSNVSYDFTIRLFPKAPVQFVGGLKGNFYFKNKSSTSPTTSFSQEIIDISKELESIIQPTIGYIIGVQTNPTKRLMLNFSFENTFTSYLKNVKYQGVSYKSPKNRIPKFSLFLTYSIFKPKIKTE